MSVRGDPNVYQSTSTGHIDVIEFYFSGSVKTMMLLILPTAY
jgi:hypothetical protein